MRALPILLVFAVACGTTPPPPPPSEAPSTTTAPAPAPSTTTPEAAPTPAPSTPPTTRVPSTAAPTTVPTTTPTTAAPTTPPPTDPAPTPETSICQQAYRCCTAATSALGMLGGAALQTGCGQIRSVDESHADLCRTQMDTVRQTLHQLGTAVPAACRE